MSNLEYAPALMNELVTLEKENRHRTFWKPERVAVGYESLGTAAQRRATKHAMLSLDKTKSVEKSWLRLRVQRKCWMLLRILGGLAPSY